ncbi:MAG: M15 family metallopeptidase, partial [Ectothiorhodospiraceae bacterium]|jgi:hypothetical protein|nr:M15 family metallopeptidase [Ectothiorhodospiraceae bacterium]
MNLTTTRILQTQLLARGHAVGAVDGRIGPVTRAAIVAALEALSPATKDDWRRWPRKRRAVLCLQALCLDAGIDPGALDGWWGPQTEYAAGQLAVLQQTGARPEPWRDRIVTPANPNHWPLEHEADLRAFYGEPGQHLAMLDLPYPLHLSWHTATRVTRTQCHTRVRDSLGRVLSAVLAHYGAERIHALRLDLYGGGFNLREKRGGSTLSTHAWGIAFDFDPTRNKLPWGRDRAAFARPEYDAWWRCWEDEGWVSLGRARNFDWMHVQAARV